MAANGAEFTWQEETIEVNHGIVRVSSSGHSDRSCRVVRSTQKAPEYGFPAHQEIAAGRAPCRHCLQLIKVNEEVLFFDYDPFRELGVPPLPGPVYVHARNCARHEGGGAFPEEYRGRLLTLDAYGEDRALVKEVRLSGGDGREGSGEAV